MRNKLETENVKGKNCSFVLLKRKASKKEQILTNTGYKN